MSPPITPNPTKVFQKPYFRLKEVPRSVVKSKGILFKIKSEAKCCKYMCLKLTNKLACQKTPYWYMYVVSFYTGALHRHAAHFFADSFALNARHKMSNMIRMATIVLSVAIVQTSISLEISIGRLN